MSARPMSRSSAARASLAAKAGLALLAPAAIAGAILALPAIPTPHFDPPDLTPPGTAGQGEGAVRPVNFASLGNALTLAARFSPAPPTPPGATGDGDGQPFSPPAATGPVVRFLGAVAEPGRYVALLSIDGRQKFLGPGDLYNRVRVVECTAAEVKVQIENPDGSAGARQSIAVAQREGPGWTTGTASSSTEPTPGSGDPGLEPMSMPGMPAGFTPPPGMSPQQIQQIQREFQARQQDQRGDGSQ